MHVQMKFLKMHPFRLKMEGCTLEYSSHIKIFLLDIMKKGRLELTEVISCVNSS